MQSMDVGLHAVRARELWSETTATMSASRPFGSSQREQRGSLRPPAQKRDNVGCIVDDDDGLLIVVGIRGQKSGQNGVVVVVVGRVVVVAALFLLLLLLGRRHGRTGRSGHRERKRRRRSQEQGDRNQGQKERTKVDAVECVAWILLRLVTQTSVVRSAVL